MALPEATRERLGIGDFNPDNVQLTRSNNYGANLPVWQQRAKFGRVINPTPPGQSDQDIELNQLGGSQSPVADRLPTQEGARSAGGQLLTDWERDNNRDYAERLVENARRAEPGGTEDVARQHAAAEAAIHESLPDYLRRTPDGDSSDIGSPQDV